MHYRSAHLVSRFSSDQRGRWEIAEEQTPLRSHFLTHHPFLAGTYLFDLADLIYLFGHASPSSNIPISAPTTAGRSYVNYKLVIQKQNARRRAHSKPIARLAPRPNPRCTLSPSHLSPTTPSNIPLQPTLTSSSRPSPTSTSSRAAKRSTGSRAATCATRISSART